MLKRVLVVAITFLAAGCGGATPTPASTPVAQAPESPGCSGRVEPNRPIACATPEAPRTGAPTDQPPSPGCGASGAVASLEMMRACTQLPEPIELPAPVKQLESWTYVKSDFNPKITFSIGQGWTSTQATAGFFDIQNKPGDLDVVAVQFGNVTEADTAEEAAANVKARPNLTVSPPEDVRIDGYDGIHLVIETTDPLDLQPVVFHPVIQLLPGDVSIASARRLELNLLDVDGQVLAIMLGGSIYKWNRATRLGTPVIESVQIGD